MHIFAVMSYILGMALGTWLLITGNLSSTDFVVLVIIISVFSLIVWLGSVPPQDKNSK